MVVVVEMVVMISVKSVVQYNTVQKRLCAERNRPMRVFIYSVPRLRRVGLHHIKFYHMGMAAGTRGGGEREREGKYRDILF